MLRGCWAWRGKAWTTQHVCVSEMLTPLWIPQVLSLRDAHAPLDFPGVAEAAAGIKPYF